MNYQETVNYLKSYKDLYYHHEYLSNRIEGIKAIGYEDKNIGPCRTLNDYLDEKYQVEQKMAEIEDLIGNIECYRQKLVLKYKFLEFMTLEMVADKMNYSYRQVCRYYREGIENIKNSLILV
ncbi:MAG: hypothetical protein ACLUVC_13660 [Longibaculum sp.]